MRRAVEAGPGEMRAPSSRLPLAEICLPIKLVSDLMYSDGALSQPSFQQMIVVGTALAPSALTAAIRCPASSLAMPVIF